MGEECWVGIDVGGKRKGFDVAVLYKEKANYVGNFRSSDLKTMAATIVDLKPNVVAIDSPQGWAQGDERSRSCEREFAGLGICGIRFTPDLERGKSGSYYEWIRNGLELWRELAAQFSKNILIEVFPTASWTCWAGKRRTATRASWSSVAMNRYDKDHALGLRQFFSNQDKRDSFAAALTGWQWGEGGAIAVSAQDEPGPGSAEAGIVIPEPGGGFADWPG